MVVKENPDRKKKQKEKQKNPIVTRKGFFPFLVTMFKPCFTAKILAKLVFQRADLEPLQHLKWSFF